MTSDFVFVRHLGSGSQARVDLYASRDKIQTPESLTQDYSKDLNIAEESKLLNYKDSRLSSNTVEMIGNHHQK